MLFGSISAKKNTASEVRSVLTVTADSPQIRLTATVTSVATPRWAIFVQIKMVLIV